MAEFIYEKPFQSGSDVTQYRQLTSDHVRVTEFGGRKILQVDPEALEILARQAFSDVNFYMRTSHLEKLAAILKDPEATDNDRFVAWIMLRNTVISAEGKLPWCQDTGTAIVMANKGEDVFTGTDDAERLSRGVWETYGEKNLRYSQVVPSTMFEEKNTGSNLPAQVDITSVTGNEYKFLFIAKGGGSANKTFLYQQSKSLLNEASLKKFIREKIEDYHLAVVIGGTSAEATLKAVKLASAGYLDNLPSTGNAAGRAFRDREWEQKIELICQEYGVGAQFGGKYFVHDVRVIRLPRHAASCPVGIGVSCSADRNIKGKITAEGIFLEQLELHPERFMPEKAPQLDKPVEINLERPMKEILAELTKYPVRTRLSLSGTLVVARDIAHARIKQMLDEGKPMPEYFKDHPVYYAGPAKIPQGMASGSFGPTTAGRMDGYVDLFQSLGGSMIMLAKGNRSRQVIDSCKKHGGFYLGSVGGPAAVLAAENILSVELVAFEELGMEAVRKIVVKNMPAFILTDDKGNDFFDQYNKRQ
jgi:fumarate hydratase class I